MVNIFFKHFFILLLLPFTCFGMCLENKVDATELNYNELSSLVTSNNACIEYLRAKGEEGRAIVIEAIKESRECKDKCSQEVRNNFMKANRKACRAGFMDACFVDQSHKIAIDKEEKEDITFAFELCKKNSMKACEFLGFHLQEKNIGKDFKLYLEKACNLRSRLACNQLKFIEREKK